MFDSSGNPGNQVILPQTGHVNPPPPPVDRETAFSSHTHHSAGINTDTRSTPTPTTNHNPAPGFYFRESNSTLTKPGGSVSHAPGVHPAPPGGFYSRVYMLTPLGPHPHPHPHPHPRVRQTACLSQLPGKPSPVD